ncbi:MAG: anthranilate phosphoribosyltransferase [Nakamurella sp.]
MAGEDLSGDDCTWAMGRIMSGDATGAEIAGFAVALRAKGETAAEVNGLAAGMLAHAKRFTVAGRSVDIVGTGGDNSNSVNISTMAAIVTAAAGATVVKHGGRGSSSMTGAADVLESLGVAISLSPDAVRRCVEEVGIGFCFAAAFHPSMRHAAGPRRELGVPTFFNILGPLTNPAQPAAAAIGCGSLPLAPLMADVLAVRGIEALVFRGDDGLDELTTTTTSTVWRVRDGVVDVTSVDPRELGLAVATQAELRGGEAAFNADVVRRLVAGETGPVRDAVVLNAAAALAAHRGLTDNLTDDLQVGLAAAADALTSGRAAELLQRWITVSQAASA